MAPSLTKDCWRRGWRSFTRDMRKHRVETEVETLIISQFDYAIHSISGLGCNIEPQIAESLERQCQLCMRESGQPILLPED